VLCVVAAALLSAPLTGCASSGSDSEELAAAAEPESVVQLASSLGLRAKPMDHRRRVVIEETWGGDRILLFPDTRSVTVRGRRYKAKQVPWSAGGTMWVDGADADAIRRLWRETTPLGRPNRSLPSVTTGSTANRSPSSIDGLPPPLPDRGTVRNVARGTVRNVAPSSAGGSGPSAAERRAWAVPLRRDWRYIVVHHSATPSGSAKSFHAAHVKRGWDGLGYHFVIGNGRGMRDGEIKSGFRWPKQREGAHAGDDLFNQHGIGICLVGDFSKTAPTARQMQSLRRLCDFLSAYCAVSPQNLRLHGDFRKTACPGKHFPRSFTFRPMSGVSRGNAHASR
jgi:hypothetical protein